MMTASNDYIFAVTPLIPPGILLLSMLENPLNAFGDGPPSFTAQVIAYMALAVLGFILTNELVPHIKVI